MLVDKINDVVKLIDEVHRLENKKFEYQEYEKFLEKLKKETQRFYRFVLVSKLLMGIDNKQFELREVDNIRTINLILLEKLMKKELPQGELNELCSKIGYYEQALKQNWKQYVTDESDNIINALKNIRNLADDKVTIDNIISQLNKLKDTWPISQGDVSVLNYSIAQGQQIIQNLNIGGGVEQFLNLVTHGQATIDDLSEDVLQWLRKNNFSTKLKLVFSAKEDPYGR